VPPPPASQPAASPGNLLVLAEAAMEAGNYEEAFGYYSRALEADPTNARAWIGKGIAAGGCSTLARPRVDEMVSLVRRGPQAVAAGPTTLLCKARCKAK
jgi:Flp pilus assembly protein TadD